MNEIKQELIRKALEQYRDIAPCSTKRDLGDCFTMEDRRVCFWFNTTDCTTHMLVAES